ncbi:hypothetical protein HanIR_Chr14g0678291 [Helianthus annuus]|nr:hypothetical protein HanIR_Chr14g0678291 [Helianthus annuus]
MMLRNSPTKDHQKNSPLKSQGIIKDSATERCCFTDPQVDRIRHCFPSNTSFKPFDPTVLSDYISKTWVAFPVTPFMIGYSYPFPEFTQSFFSLTGISYIQAMPMIWRVLYVTPRPRKTTNRGGNAGECCNRIIVSNHGYEEFHFIKY